MAGVENWFVDVAGTHTSLPALVFFRSPHWEHRVRSGLDGASLLASTVERPCSADAELCIRAGYVALRRIADFFVDDRAERVAHPAPQPVTDLICRRARFDLPDAGALLSGDG